MAVFTDNLNQAFPVNKPLASKRTKSLYHPFLENRRNYRGFYIDIGAHHSYPFSNDLHTAQKGWQKITVEPVSQSSNLLALFSKTNLDLDDRGKPGVFSSFQRINTAGSVVKIINVKKTPLRTLLDDILPVSQIIEFLSVDIAGLDIRALKLLEWERCNPLFIIVKHAAGMKNGGDTIYAFLLQKNYELVASAEDVSFFKCKRK